MRYKARVKRSIQPVSVQRGIQWGGLIRRAHGAELTGNVHLSFGFLLIFVAMAVLSMIAFLIWTRSIFWMYSVDFPNRGKVRLR